VEAGEIEAKAPDKPAVDNAVESDIVTGTGTESASDGPPDGAASQNKTESTESAAVKGNEAISPDTAEKPAAVEEPEKAVEIAGTTADEPEKKAAPAAPAPVKDKAPEIARVEAPAA
jgi:hypothetical protein